MPSTIKDVAREAGVSVATVSRALNGAGNVLPQTRQRIVEVAAALRFSPSGAARSLITRCTQTVGALLPDLHGEYFSELIRGIDVAARARGLHLLVSSSHGDASEAAAALRAMNGRVDGLLVMSPHVDDAFLRGNLPSGLPVVLMNTRPQPRREGEMHPSFTVDNFGGAQAMVRHLVTRGYRRIAFITGPAGNHEANERLRGYREALAEALPGAAPLVLDGDFSESTGWRAGRELLNMAQRPDAVFAGNDMMAVGCMAALREGGLRLPEDMAVTGFDDIPIARYLSPALTTMRVPVVGLGALALEALAHTIGGAGASVPLNQTLNVELVMRQSAPGPTATPNPGGRDARPH